MSHCSIVFVVGLSVAWSARVKTKTHGNLHSNSSRDAKQDASETSQQYHAEQMSHNRVGSISSSRSEDLTELQIKAEADLAAGTTFQGRFLLEKKLWRQKVKHRNFGDKLDEGSIRRSDVSTVLHARPDLPSSIEKRVAKNSVEYLGKGSFGQIWKAKDLTNGQVVSLKVFYHGGPADFLRWINALGSPTLESHLEAAAHECAVAVNMQAYAGSSAEGLGAQRLMRCHEDHVTRGVSRTGHVVSDDDVLYQVLEYCGDQNVEDWMKAELSKPDLDKESYFEQTRRILKQIMEGLHYMTSHETKWVHHDLKPANVVVKKKPGCSTCPLTVKLVDFGSVTELSESNAEKPLPATIAYAAPEAFVFDRLFQAKSLFPMRGYDYEHFWSFDVYSAAASFVEMLTGSMAFDKFQALAKQKGIGFSLMRERQGDKCIRAIFLLQIVKPHVSTEEFKEALQIEDLESLVIRYPAKTNENMLQLWHRQCAQVVEYSLEKGVDGYEHLVTKSFGLPDQESRPWQSFAAELWQSNVADIFLRVEDAGGFSSSMAGNVVGVADWAKKKSVDKFSGWGELFMRMMAYASKVRPRPEEVLQSTLLKDVPYVADPDFQVGAIAPNFFDSSGIQSSTFWAFLALCCSIFW